MQATLLQDIGLCVIAATVLAFAAKLLRRVEDGTLDQAKQTEMAAQATRREVVA